MHFSLSLSAAAPLQHRQTVDELTDTRPMLYALQYAWREQCNMDRPAANTPRQGNVREFHNGHHVLYAYLSLYSLQWTVSLNRCNKWHISSTFY